MDFLLGGGESAYAHHRAPGCPSQVTLTSPAKPSPCTWGVVPHLHRSGEVPHLEAAIAVAGKEVTA